MDVVEVNPGLDPPPGRAEGADAEGCGAHTGGGGAMGGAMHGDHPAIAPRTTATVRLAVELVLSALGKQIC